MLIVQLPPRMSSLLLNSQSLTLTLSPVLSSLLSLEDAAVSSTIHFPCPQKLQPLLEPMESCREEQIRKEKSTSGPTGFRQVYGKCTTLDISFLFDRCVCKMSSSTIFEILCRWHRVSVRVATVRKSENTLLVLENLLCGYIVVFWSAGF